MENNKVLVLRDVSVRYRKQDSRATSDIFRRLIGKAPRSNEFWAMKHMSFELEKGDMLGVIGKNGAGKSTMMKAISGTLTPASGEIERHGKICALLELGAGFDRDMTVKENVYLRGALLGYSKEYIDGKYDEMIEFAGMREFEDNAFRTLSSGMKSRIAFAIASMVEPDIIILDEIFAVGDGEFKKKSQQKMQSILDSGNCTALMVSHSMSTVKQQCNKVLWMHKGETVMFGEPNKVCDEYAKFLETGVMPVADDVEKPNKEPVNCHKRSLGRRTASFAIGLGLALFAVLGCFVWSQYDLVHAYIEAKNSTAEELLAAADGYHESIYTILGVDNSEWDMSAFGENADRVINEEISYSELAKIVLDEAGQTDAADYKIRLAAAEIEAVKTAHLKQLDELVDTVRAEFEQQPEGKYRSLIAYAYENRSRFYELEDSCDEQMQDITKSLRTQLRKNDMPETLADKIITAYENEKSEYESYYCIRLR